MAVVVLAAAMAWWEPSRPGPVRILAVPELEDMRPVLEEFTRETRIPVELEVAEKARISQRVARGRPDFDAVWSHTELETGSRELGEGTTVMSSPVVLGLRKSLVDELGWTGGVTWEHIIRAARERAFTFGMSAPESSFTGRSAVLAAAAGLSRNTDRLSEQDIYPVAGELRSLSSAQAFTASTDTGLVEDFLREEGGLADGIFTYESQIARLNASGRLAERLVPLRPGGRAATAWYALRPLLRPRTAETAEGLTRLTGHLLTREAQQRIADLTYRRPGSPGITLPEVLSGPAPRLLSVSEDQYVVHGLIDAYLGRYRYFSSTLFLLDVSGSMRGTRLAEMREAAAALVEAPLNDDPEVGDVQLLLLPFGSRPAEPSVTHMSARDPAEDLRAVNVFLDGLVPRGNAALYDALVAGYRKLEEVSDRDRVVSIILITGGASGEGRDLAGFLRHHAALAPWLRDVPVYPVLVGGGDEPEMRRLADHTGGRVLDARDGELSSEFLTARAGL